MRINYCTITGPTVQWTENQRGGFTNTIFYARGVFLTK